MKRILKIFSLITLLVLLVSCTVIKRPEVIEEYYTISFNTNGGNIIEDIKVSPNEYIDKPANPVNNDLLFINWYLNINYEIRFDFNKPVTKSLTLYARWHDEYKYINEAGLYNSKDEVAIYLLIYGKLPSNYLLKEEVSGHISSYWTINNLKTIGGNNFYNMEQLLPIERNLYYFEADIDYKGESNRNAKRIVFSNRLDIYYTSDHYSSFILFNEGTLKW